MTRTNDSETYLTPPQLARKWGVNVEKVLHWIHSGELAAINVATRLNGQRPRFRIRPQDAELFEKSRATAPAPKPARRQTRIPRHLQAGWVNYDV